MTELDQINAEFQTASKASKPRKQLTPEEKAKKLAEAYAATQGGSVYNYSTIFAHYLNLGINEDEIDPRGNVLTYGAWLSGRSSHGSRVPLKGQDYCTITLWRPVDRDNPKAGKRPISCKVWHVSQTTQAK